MSKENNIKEATEQMNSQDKLPAEIIADPNSQIEKENNDFIVIKDKIDELKYFDAISHFKENIIHFNKNCTDPIKDNSYYCFTCKHSICDECGSFAHKEHLLIQRKNCLNYDKTFFNDVSKMIEENTNIDKRKIQIKEEISKSIAQLKEQLDVIEKEKLKEIDKFFEEIKENYII